MFFSSRSWFSALLSHFYLECILLNFDVLKFQKIHAPKSTTSSRGTAKAFGF